jgi:hypothetical protein
MPTQTQDQKTKIVSTSVPAASKEEPRDSSNDAQWRLAQRIASSRSFGRSQLLRRFLFHVCNAHAQGRASELTEHQIGIHVFGRSEHYDSDNDNIVRHYARTLRKRVEEYFTAEGKHEELGLDIPRGGYSPVFYPRFPEKASQQKPGLVEASSTPVIEGIPVAEEIPPSDPTGEAIYAQAAPSRERSPHRFPSSHRQLVLLVIVVLGALIAIATVALQGLSAVRRSVKKPASREGVHANALWSQLFQKDRDTFIVAADSGLVIMQGLSGRRVSLDEYASGKYRASGSANSKLSNVEAEELGTRRYTSIVDLELVLRLSRLREVNPERMLLRYSRDLHMDNLRSGNAILLGSADSNPWASMFEQQLNFRFFFDPKKGATPVIVNQHPLAGEQPVYANDYDGPWRKTYGTISWLPNLDGTGKVLLIAGINMAGTQAAGSFVLNPSLMKPVLDRAKSPDGNIRPFEILIESNNVAANASRPRAVAERISR